MDSSIKRLISSLNNISIQENKPESFFIYKNYCVVGNGKNIFVYHKVENVWKEIKGHDYTKIFELAGFKLINKVTKRNKPNYINSFKKDYRSLRTSNPITDVEESYSGIDKKKKFCELYKECFGVNDSSKNRYTSFLYLGKLQDDVDNSVEVIFKDQNNKDYIERKKVRNVKSQIQKNLKGAERFKKYASELPQGVYKLCSIPLTHFVKISNPDWNDTFLKIQQGHIEDSEEEFEGIYLFIYILFYFFSA